MKCVELLQYHTNISTLCLVVQCGIVFLVFRKSQVHYKRRSFLGAAIILVLLHPRIWLTSDDCGADLFKPTLLFLFSGLALVILMNIRSNLEPVQQQENNEE